MGSLLHKLWDETLAGPTPENGLGKLRKLESFPSSSMVADEVKVTRSITILRTNPRDFSAGPNTPLTPGTPSVGSLKNCTRRKSPAEALERPPHPISPNFFDWIKD